MFVMEPSKDAVQQNTPAPPRVLYDNGHDNKVFVGEGIPQPQFTNPQTNGTNGSTNAYYINGNAHTNTNRDTDDVQATYRVVENSRL